MNMNKPQQRWPKNVRLMDAGWYQDPWDLSGDAATERWWTGLIWSDRTRLKKEEAVRDITTSPEERTSND